jgi:hypothetical protein
MPADVAVYNIVRIFTRKPNGSDRLSIRHRSASKLEFDIRTIRKHCIFPVCALKVVKRDVNNGIRNYVL